MFKLFCQGKFPGMSINFFFFAKSDSQLGFFTLYNIALIFNKD